MSVLTALTTYVGNRYGKAVQKAIEKIKKGFITNIEQINPERAVKYQNKEINKHIIKLSVRNYRKTRTA